SVAPQLPPERANGAVTTTEMPVPAAVPLLVSVRFCAALVVVSTWLVKVSEVGVTLRTGVFGAATISTAPASTKLSVFRRLPKKSVLGANVKAPVVPLLPVAGMRWNTDDAFEAGE